MRLPNTVSALFVCLTMALSASAQDQNIADVDSTGLPGDNFSLQGALDLFKKSSSPEEFEKLLNSEDNKVNNLDLNGDGQIDYIRVVNKKDNDVQIFILQALVSDQESQDIAVISLQKTGDANAVVQIEGDEDIYGTSKIAEPIPDADNAFTTSNFSGSLASNSIHGPAVENGTGIIVNVWFWPCVRYVYAPSYVIWTSPFTWVVRPRWWHPWHPMPYYVYRPYCVHYATRYVVVPTRRIPPARVMYAPARMTSVTVINRNRIVVNNYRNTRQEFRQDNRQGYRMDNRQGYRQYRQDNRMDNRAQRQDYREGNRMQRQDNRQSRQDYRQGNRNGGRRSRDN